MKWQPIETAPRLERVLVFGGERINRSSGYAMMQCAYIDGIGHAWADDRLIGAAPIKPTHWMPLPEPPSVTKVPQDKKEAGS